MIVSVFTVFWFIVVFSSFSFIQTHSLSYSHSFTFFLFSCLGGRRTEMYFYINKYIYECVNVFSFLLSLFVWWLKSCMFTILHARHKANVYIVSAIYQIGLNNTSFSFIFDTIPFWTQNYMRSLTLLYRLVCVDFLVSW